MKALFYAAFGCVLSCAVALTCNVGNASSCGPQDANYTSACYTCDLSPVIEAGSCSVVPFSQDSSCQSLGADCDSAGGVFNLCFGNACNSCSARFRPLSVDLWGNKSVAFVTAHPDDLEALAGATVAALTKQAS
jgi:hypothetical protein